MPMPKVEDLRREVMREERHLSWVSETHGTDSDEYKEALKKFARVWFVLKMMHKHDEFLTEVTAEESLPVEA